MKILFLSWRDIKNPKMGGADIFTHEAIKRLVEAGHEIDHISPMYDGGMTHEKIDGVYYHRSGGNLGVITFARKWYKDHDYDLVVDQCNTHHFFSYLWLPKDQKRMFFIHQLTREIWFQQMAWPFCAIGRAMETPMLARYKDYPTITVSESTKSDLVDIGFAAGNIDILPEGIDFESWDEENFEPKEQKFTVTYLGRASKYKGIQVAIEAFALFYQKNKNSQMWLITKLNDKQKIEFEQLVESLGIKDVVTFFGFVDLDTKLKLLSRSHTIVVPSLREGWGLIVTEANAVGTIAVVYDSPGLRDSVKHYETGLVCRQNNAQEICRNLLKLHNEKDLLAELQHNAHEWSKTFSWDNVGEAMEQAVMRVESR